MPKTDTSKISMCKDQPQYPSRSRLDRLISKKLEVSRRTVREIVANGRIHVDGVPADSAGQLVHQFTHLTIDGTVLQSNTPSYLMMNKPTGVISATKDDQHRTVINLLNIKNKQNLHIAGRLDINSTGLLLLTNNSSWSRKLSSPEEKVVKRYLVTVEKPLTEENVEAFANGMYFAYEDITTRPAILKILSDHNAQVELTEGRYRQIRRMFGHIQNRVLSLHRFAIGPWELDPSLQPGEYRELTQAELKRLD